MLGSLKFESPDKYLLSIKSKAGLEFSRIFISHDTIMINDKINRKMYCGSTLFLKNKYGITLEILPLLFGDLIEETGNDNNQSKCIDGKITMLGVLSGIKNSIIIDCKKGKIVLIKTENDISERDIEIKYNNFMMSGGIKIPGMIEIENFQDKTIVKIRIKKVEFPWDGKIEFIPGNRYEILRLQ
ncbi:MAG: DUF4292 domain-containing protein [Candidatus Pacearchaeota archaeon]|nr:DUF4292 domain-containing protein [Candidatus Pacearchaeota archaeon]